MTAEQSGSRARAGIARRGAAIAWLAGAMSLSAFMARADVLPESAAWLAGLLSHWQWVYAALAVVGSLIALMGRRPVLHLIPLVVVAGTWMATVTPAAPTWQPETGAAPRVTLTVATANLNFARTDHSALQAWLTSNQASDVIALQEFTDSARAAVETPAVLAAYPHRILDPSPDQFGIAVLSKHPMKGAEKVAPPPSNPLATVKLRMVLAVGELQVALTAVHPMPPISGAYAQERDRSLREEAQRLAESGLPGILLGDMNDTPWSTGLRATAPLLRASGLQPTWPNAWGWASLLPLDHILLTPGSRVKSSGLGPNLLSDHRPVVAHLLL